ncbi:uncharacterized protein LOC131333536 [Rhododendron vialii]|uniref:uncharacterized protein LOC131333536 n=1 Tax=Rhododendron vialii TaxID=182163 RepID=UPI00265DD90C|nr:uncharacterized protein LOC131333536 [Rhododendron vialii]
MKSKLYVNHPFRTDGIPKWYNVKMVVKNSTSSMELLVKDTKAEFILRSVPSDLKKLMLKENRVQILKKYLSQFYGRAYVFIIHAPQPMYHEHCASVVTFVLTIDWSEECLHISKGMSKTDKEPMRSRENIIVKALWNGPITF